MANKEPTYEAQRGAEVAEASSAFPAGMTDSSSASGVI